MRVSLPLFAIHVNFDFSRLTMREKAELLPAHVWTCNECGTDQFERCIVPELTDEDRADLMQQLGIEVWQEGTFLTHPTTVTCRNCQTVYETELFQPVRQEDSDCES